MALSNECRRSEGVLLTRPSAIIPPDPEPEPSTSSVIIWAMTGSYSRDDSVVISDRTNLNLGSEIWEDTQQFDGFECRPAYIPPLNLIAFANGSDLWTVPPLDGGGNLRVDTSAISKDLPASMVYDYANSRLLVALNDTWSGSSGTQSIGYVNTTTWVYTEQNTTIRPYDMAVNNTTGNAYLVDYENGKILRHTLSTITSTGDEVLDVGDPFVSCAVDETNDYLYALHEGGQIERFDGQDLSESVTPAVTIVNSGTFQISSGLMFDPATNELLTLNDSVDYNYHAFDATLTGQDYATHGTDLGQIWTIETGFALADIPVEAISKPVEPNAPGPTDRNKILCQGGSNLYILDKLDATSFTELTTPGTYNLSASPIYLPNEDLIVYGEINGDVFSITPADTGKTLRVDVSSLVTGGTFVSVGHVSALVYDSHNDRIIAAFTTSWSSSPSIGFIDQSTWTYTEKIDAIEATCVHRGHPLVSSMAVNVATENVYWVVKNGGDHDRVYRRNLSDLLTTCDYTLSNNAEAVAVDEIRDKVFVMTQEGEVIVYDGQDLRGQYVRPYTCVKKYPFAGVSTYNDGEMIYDPELNEIIIYNATNDHLHSWDASATNQNLASSTDLGTIATQSGSFAFRSIGIAELP